jgi:hypothetical protein
VPGVPVGTALLNTVAASATASYIAAHLSPRTLTRGGPSHQLTGLALVHGYSAALWVSAAIFAGGAVLAGLLLRWGPLTARATVAAEADVTAVEPAATSRP